MLRLEELFCRVDDFCQRFEPIWHKQLLTHGLQQRNRARRRRSPRQMGLSEIMTILIAFHQQHYRTLKHFYTEHVCVYWRDTFPGLVSYSRFVRISKTAWDAAQASASSTQASLKVYHNRRIEQHRVFDDLAARGRTSVDWFYGLKLHLVVNDPGELLNLTLTPGNTNDRKPVPCLLKALFGKVFADRGDVSQALFEQSLNTCGIEFFARPKRNCVVALDAAGRQAARSQAFNHRVDHRPTQEHFTN